MVGTNVKGETKALMDKRAELEAEMNSIISRLTQPDGPGLSGNLLDSEGFPRSDIDIPAVRAERHRLSELRNDHRVITDTINENIQILHSTKRAGNDESSNMQNSFVNAVTSTSSEDSASAMNINLIARMPFAMVDEIADGSPAAEDGLQLGDQIVKFGNVEAGDNLREKLASESQMNQDRAVYLVVLRQGAVINLTVTPRMWQGRGLLGCHFQML